MESGETSEDISCTTKKGESGASAGQQTNQEENSDQTVTFEVTDACEVIQQDAANEPQTSYEAQVVEQQTEHADTGESSNQLQAADDQEMGLAVAILELIGSRPHIVTNPPTETNQQEEYVNVPIKGTKQIVVEVPPSEHGDNQNQQQVQESADTAAETAVANIREGAATVGDTTAAVDDEDKSKASGKRKRGRSKGGKKKLSEEQKSEDQPSKKKKKTDKKGDDEASTSSENQTKEKAPKSFFCTVCQASFNRKDNLKVHIRSKHNTELVEETSSSRTKCLNPACDETFYHKTQMLRHMEEEHGLEIQKTEIEFKTLDDFKKWKTEEETKKYVFFSSYRGPAANKSGKGSHLYFKCQKDGPNRPHRKLGEPMRKTERRNRKGSVKTGLMCPARMICKVDGKTGKVKLTYIYSHSHPITCEDTEHQPVPDSLKKELMDKLTMGTPIKQLYKDVRKVSAEKGAKSSPHAVESVHYITLRSLDLLKHRVDMKRRLHHDERTSILLLVEKLKAETHNPILIYKPQGSAAVAGDESLMHLPFADDLSVLALQTEEQMKFIKQGAMKVIYVDTSYGGNPTDLKLISLIAPDSHQQGYAVGHLIANRIDEHLLYYFIKAIKERCGVEFQPSTIMTDEDNTGYGVFQAVFPGVTFNHLFSKWHIHRAWLKRMSRDIQNTTLRHEIYHSLFVMMEERNLSKFTEMASNFVTHYASKSQTFTEYFVEMYRTRPELWAMSYREQTAADDVIFMNNYHSNLKAFYGQKRKASKRIDSLVNILLDVDKDAAWRRVKRVYEGGPEAGVEEFSSHHDKGMLITEDQIEDCSAEEQDKVWLVPSHNNKDVKHKVTKLYNVCLDDNCTLKCLEVSCFGLCHHLYECSCYDEIDICQHIHRVHSLRISQLQTPQSLHCTDLGAYVEIHYMDEDDSVGVATQNVQTTEVVPVVTETTDEAEAESSTAQVGTLQSRLQHLVNLLGSRQVDDILLSHVTGTVDQLISTCEAAGNQSSRDTGAAVDQLISTCEAAPNNPVSQT